MRCRVARVINKNEINVAQRERGRGGLTWNTGAERSWALGYSPRSDRQCLCSGHAFTDTRCHTPLEWQPQYFFEREKNRKKSKFRAGDDGSAATRMSWRIMHCCPIKKKKKTFKRKFVIYLRENLYTRLLCHTTYSIRRSAQQGQRGSKREREWKRGRKMSTDKIRCSNEFDDKTTNKKYVNM